MNILKVKDSQGNWNDIPAIVGKNGEDYVLTSADKEEIAGMVDIPVEDVQINGTSIVTDGVANVPLANSNDAGAVIVGSGLRVNDANKLVTNAAGSSTVKTGTENYNPITPNIQHYSTFYGLAKAAGDSTQSASDNAVGTYTDGAKHKIKKMLGIPDIREAEVIADITTTEDVELVNIETDTNGNSFNLMYADIYVTFSNLPTTGSSSYYTAMAIRDVTKVDGTNASSIPTTFPTLQQTATGSSAFNYYYVNNNGCEIIMGKKGTSFTNAQNMLNSSQDFICFAKKGLKAFMFRKYSTTSSLVPTGTRIVIIGCRLIDD